MDFLRNGDPDGLFWCWTASCACTKPKSIFWRREGKKIVRNFVNMKCGRPPVGIDWKKPCLTMLRTRNEWVAVFSDLGDVRGRKSTCFTNFGSCHVHGQRVGPETALVKTSYIFFLKWNWHSGKTLFFIFFVLEKLKQMDSKVWLFSHFTRATKHFHRRISLHAEDMFFSKNAFLNFEWFLFLVGIEIDVPPSPSEHFA
jgi:hypothetical protein